MKPHSDRWGILKLGRDTKSGFRGKRPQWQMPPKNFYIPRAFESKSNFSMQKPFPSTELKLVLSPNSRQPQKVSIKIFSANSLQPSFNFQVRVNNQRRKNLRFGKLKERKRIWGEERVEKKKVEKDRLVRGEGRRRKEK